jgi:hypothetical protein
MPRILFHIHRAKQRTSRTDALVPFVRADFPFSHQSTVGNAQISVYIVPENPSHHARAKRWEKQEGA